jgi:MFS family permease
MAGLTGNIGLVASSIQYVINVLMTIPALIFMDRWGRRPMFVIGAVLMMTWMFANAGLMASYGHAAPPGGIDNIAEQSWEIAGAPARAVIACTYLFVASYAPTWGPASWVYPPEIFPLRIRGKAVALSTSCNWVCIFLTSHANTSLTCPRSSTSHFHTSSHPLSSTSNGAFTSSSASFVLLWLFTLSSSSPRRRAKRLKMSRKCSWLVCRLGRRVLSIILRVGLNRDIWMRRRVGILSIAL